MIKAAREKIVGVLGGMGPDATVELMRRVIRATPADDDADHIHMIVDNNPKVPSRIKALIEGTGEDPTPHLAAMAARLEEAGADFMVIPCNTAHHYHRQIADGVSVPVWNLIDITARHIVDLDGDIRTVGMLGSDAVRRVGLFDKTFSSNHLDLIYPSSVLQADLLDVIKGIKAGVLSPDQAVTLQGAAEDLRRNGAQVLLIACTELSILADEMTFDLPALDTLQILADEIVRVVKSDS